MKIETVLYDVTDEDVENGVFVHRELNDKEAPSNLVILNQIER